MFDSLKNVLDADRPYMHTRHAMEGWMLVNFIALKLYYTLLNLLKKHDLNSRHSPADLIEMLSEIKKVRIDGQWHDAETTKKTADLLDKLGIRLLRIPKKS